MTRFGVMKHLRVLEEAGLVATRRSGREKLHFLNPVPIRLIHDRWIDKYTEPWVAAAERPQTPTGEHHGEGFRDLHPHHAANGLWEAITDPEIRSKYNFGARIESDWTPGSALEMSAPNAELSLGEGEVLEVDPPRRLVHTMTACGATT